MSCFEKKPRSYYNYYDTPDGCDVTKKIGVAARYGLISGLILGTYDILMYSHAVGFSQMMRRYMFHALPLSLMGATFAAVSNGLLHYRKRDDKLNYFLGGLACGPILGKYLGSGHGVVVGGLALGVIAMVKKDSVEYCVPLTPVYTPHMGTIRGWRSDYTLVRDPRDEMRHTCEDSK